MAAQTETAGDKERGTPKSREGVVVSDKMAKTVVVAVSWLKKHAKYKKYLKATRKFFAHDESDQAKVGDVVEIVECRPMSRMKRWRVNRILVKAADQA